MSTDDSEGLLLPDGMTLADLRALISGLAQSFMDVLAPTEDATEMFTVVGLILVDPTGDDGEFWPDAQQVTFTDPEPAPERERSARERLQDWIDRSGDVLEVDGSGYTRGGATGEPPAWDIPTGPATVRLYPGPPEEDR